MFTFIPVIRNCCTNTQKFLFFYGLHLHLAIKKLYLICLIGPNFFNCPIGFNGNTFCSNLILRKSFLL